ncbi:hypothetical protein D1007_35107 [Hordeum vulgare]|nr:hypothetical protein D1007_35107 [Hordeum vulgare]
MPLVAFISLTTLGNIPCTIRDSLKHVAGRSFNFKADGNRYVLDVYRGHNTTVMGGNDWVKFVTDFNLGAGSYVVFDTSKRTTEAYVVHLGFGDFANDGESDEDVEGEGESGIEEANTTGAGLSKLRATSLGGEAMEDGDGEQPDQLL